MAKHVYLIRHAKQDTKKDGDAWQVNASLIPGAEERIKFVAQQLMDCGVRFSAFRYSLLVRSRQTCEFLQGFMNSDAPMKLNEKLGPGEVEEWNTLYDGWKREQPDPENPPLLGPVEFSSLWPDLCEREGKRVLSAVEEIAKEVQAGQNAAAISHNPLVRLAQAQAQGKVEGPDLQHCQAICFTFEDDRLVGCEALLF